MKNVLATGITSSSQQPYTKKTHEWYNDMTKEVAEAFVKSLIPSSWYTGKLVILNGCELTGTNPSLRTIAEGWVWYDGEIFRVESGEFTTTGLEIGIWSISTNADNLIFSDGASKPVTQERTFVMSNGLSGSGLFDETDVDVIKPLTNTLYIEIGEWKMADDSAKTVDMSSIIDDTHKIAGIDCVIHKTGGSIRKLEYVNPSTFASEGSFSFVNGTTKEIYLYRKAAGIFDDASYNDAGVNRGYISVTLLK